VFALGLSVCRRTPPHQGTLWVPSNSMSSRTHIPRGERGTGNYSAQASLGLSSPPTSRWEEAGWGGVCGATMCTANASRSIEEWSVGFVESVGSILSSCPSYPSWLSGQSHGSAYRRSDVSTQCETRHPRARRRAPKPRGSERMFRKGQQSREDSRRRCRFRNSSLASSNSSWSIPTSPSSHQSPPTWCAS
jgi:hypothetical protein